ncbi:MAG TPA: MFS transporter [Streptosporangiaceae bacterium]
MFWRYWTGSTVSLLGDAVTSVALPLTAVTVLHASGLEVGLVTAAGFAAWMLIGLPAGTLVGRLPLRGTQVAMDLVRAVALLSVPVTAWLGLLGVPQLVLVALTVSTASVVFDIGNSTLLPSIAGRDELTARNSLTSASVSATQLCGPALGGALVQLAGAATSLLFDVASYLVSAIMLRTLPRPARLAPAKPAVSVRQSIREGWQFVTHHPVIRPCVLDATAINFVCGGLMALTPVFLIRTLHASPGLVGVLIATEGAGSLIGAALTPRLSTWLGSARAVLLAATAAPPLIILMPVATPGWGLLLFAAGNAGFAAAVVVTSILTRTHRQTVTPPELLPRVMATVRFISWGAVPLGAVSCGAAASWLGPRTALWLACAVVPLSPAVLWVSPIRTQRDLTDAPRGLRPRMNARAGAAKQAR